MAGPGDANQAQEWIQSVFGNGKLRFSWHAEHQRMVERDIDYLDVEHCLLNPVACEKYAHGAPEHGGTCWRLHGEDLEDERDIVVAFEAYQEKKRKRAIVTTVFVRGVDKEKDYE